MGRTKRRGRMPAKELVVTGLEPLPAAVTGWEVELVAPTLGPIIREAVLEHLVQKEVEVDAAE